MKNRWKSAILFAAVVGMTFTACDNNRRGGTTSTDTTQVEDERTPATGDEGTGGTGTDAETDTANTGGGTGTGRGGTGTGTGGTGKTDTTRTPRR